MTWDEVTQPVIIFWNTSPDWFKVIVVVIAIFVFVKFMDWLTD